MTINRTTRSLTLTDAGERLAQLIGPALEEISDGLEQLAELREKPAGRVRISADEYAIQQILWPKLAPVLRNYPDIHLELITDYGLVDIARERFDAGVRRGGLIALDMVAIPVSAAHRMVVVVSPHHFGIMIYLQPRKISCPGRVLISSYPHMDRIYRGRF